MPTIETQRLRLRIFQPDDTQAYNQLIGSDPAVMRFLPGRATVGTDITANAIHRYAEHWAEFGYGIWALHVKDSDQLIGHSGLQWIADVNEVEVAYALGKSYWGQGYATEAAIASLRFGFEQLGLNQIVGRVLQDNLASHIVLQKLGMVATEAYNDMAGDPELAYYVIQREAFDAPDIAYVLRY